MAGDSFRFQQFLVRQQNCAMKVGTDGVVLGCWARVSGKEQRVLDVGTGTGLISLMIAQRAQQAQVDAVEIDAGACVDAVSNFEGSPFADRLQVYNIDFQSFAENFEKNFAKNFAENFEKGGDNSAQKYDLVVSNPPFFNGTYKSVDAQRTAARHCELLNWDDLLCGVVRVLAPEGRFVVIFPYSDAAVFVAKAALVGLYCTAMLQIFPKPERGAKRMALEFSFSRVPAPRVTALTILNSEGRYTKEYELLTGDFYIRF